MTTGAGEATIAVLDSGVDASHPDLPRLAPGYDVVNHDSDPADDLGHGTEVAGAIAARLGNGIGAAGVCPLCSIMPVKVIDGVRGVASDADIVAGIVWATDHGADVINLSLAGPEYSRALQDGVGYATSRGVVVVVAAGGNDGTATKQYPAALDGVVGVAASDDHDRLYDFSNHGAHLDLAAPGCVYTTLRGGAYGEACGTSLAAPLVAGIAGLVRAHRPALTGDQVARVLVDGAKRGLGLDVADGLVDARRALELADALNPVPANTAIPRIAGTVAVGGTLTATPGTWTGDPSAYAYAWERCGAARCTAVAGALANTYELTSADAARGSASSSPPRTRVGPRLGARPLDRRRRRVVVGRRRLARVGRQLVARWRGEAPHRFRFQWQACSAAMRCSSVLGGTSATLVVTRAQLGKRLRVRTVAVGADGTASSLVSAASATSSGDTLRSLLLPNRNPRKSGHQCLSDSSGRQLRPPAANGWNSRERSPGTALAPAILAPAGPIPGSGGEKPGSRRLRRSDRGSDR